MVRPTTVLVDPSELKALFEALDLWSKIRSGRLSTEEAANKTAPSKAWPGGASFILRHFNEAGAHACTTHRIVDRDGKTVHWDEVDLKAGEVTIAKRSLASQAAGAPA